MIFPGKHGLHAGEALTGNLFEVQVSLSFLPEGRISGIDQTVNYANVFALVKAQMDQPRPLLETIAQDILADLHTSDKRIRYAKVSITKKEPPIESFSGEITVSVEQDFSHG